MGDKLKDERIQFVKEWEIRRQVGGFRYILRAFCVFGIIFGGMLLFELIINGKVAGYQVIIDAVVTILLSFVSWFVNEARYKRISKKYSI